MTTSHDTTQSGSSTAEVPTVSFSHSKPDDQVDYDQLNAAGAPGADELHMPFTAPPAHLAPTEPPEPRSPSSRSSSGRSSSGRSSSGRQPQRGGGSRHQSSSRSPRRRH